MYGKQLHPHCMNVFTELNTKRTLTGGLITAMSQQLLRIPFSDPGLALADSLHMYCRKTGVQVRRLRRAHLLRCETLRGRTTFNIEFYVTL